MVIHAKITSDSIYHILSHLSIVALEIGNIFEWEGGENLDEIRIGGRK